METTTPTNLLQPFSFVDLPIRGRVLKFADLSSHVPTLKNCAESTAQTLVELLAAAALLAYDTKHSLTVSLQIQHPQLGALMFAQSGSATSGQATLRAYANPAAQQTPFETLANTPGGLFAVTLDAPDFANRYQSMVPLTHPTAAACLADYFAQSVQTRTLFRVWSNGQAATAFMLQALPSPTPLPEDDWTRLSLHLQTLHAPEALDPTLTAQNLIERLFAEDDLTLYPAEHPEYAEDDPRPRMLAALAAMSPEELAGLIKQGHVTLTDDTTGKEVTFTAQEFSHLHKTNSRN